MCVTQIIRMQVGVAIPLNLLQKLESTTLCTMHARHFLFVSQKGLYPAFERSVRGRFREIHRNTQETGSISGIKKKRMYFTH